MQNIIELNNVFRNYRVAERNKNFWGFVLKRKFIEIEAVKNVSFSIKKGELVGFIGPNGAGKSTIIKMMTGVLVPTSGEIQVLNRSPYKNRIENSKVIGVVFGQKSQLWWDLPVIDTFMLLKSIYKIDNNTFLKNLDRYGNLLGINEFINQPVRQLSLGQKMRADLCAALLHNPQILFLDEPTIGLDVVVKKEIRKLIKKINAEDGVTVILTTHDMKDIEEICDRIIVINRGEIVVDQLVEDVKNNFRGNSVIKVSFENAVKTIELPNVEKIKISGNSAEIFYNPGKNNLSTIIANLLNKYEILDIKIQENDIDDIIRNLYLDIERK